MQKGPVATRVASRAVKPCHLYKYIATQDTETDRTPYAKSSCGDNIATQYRETDRQLMQKLPVKKTLETVKYNPDRPWDACS